MADVRLVQTPIAFIGVTLDWLLSPIGLDQSQELATAAILALGTDALAATGDVLPDIDSTDRRGWWGDLDAKEIWNAWPIGSRLWLLERAKILQAGSREGATVNRADSYTREALTPFLIAQIATDLDVTATRAGQEEIDVLATFYRGPLPAVQLRYEAMWDELKAKNVEAEAPIYRALTVKEEVVIPPPPPPPPPPPTPTVNNLYAAWLATAAPVIGTPNATAPVTGHSFTAPAVNLATPVLGTPIVAQIHKFGAGVSMATASPQLGTPVFAQVVAGTKFTMGIPSSIAGNTALGPATLAATRTGINIDSPLAAYTYQPSSAGTVLDYTNLTVGSFANRALVVFATFNSDPGTVTAVWDNGGTNQAMAQIAVLNQGGSGAFNNSIRVFALLNPVSGNKTLRVSLQQAVYNDVIVDAVSLSNVLQTSVAAAFVNVSALSGNSTTPSITTTPAANDLGVAVFAGCEVFNTYNQNVIYREQGAAGSNSMAQYQWGTGVAINFSAVLNSATWWSAIAFHIKSAGVAAGTAPSVPSNQSLTVQQPFSSGQVVGNIKWTGGTPTAWQITAGNPAAPNGFLTVLQSDGTANITFNGTNYPPLGSYTLTVQASNGYGSGSATVSVVTVGAALTAFFPGGNCISSGEWNIGTLGADYFLPLNPGEPDEATYFYNKGFRVLRLAFEWGNAQPTDGAPIADNHAAWMRYVCGNWPNMNFIFDLHNYGYRHQGAGAPGATQAQLIDFWVKAANILKPYPNAILGLMNEPSQAVYSTGQWAVIWDAVVKAVRQQTGFTGLILVPMSNNPQNWNIDDEAAWANFTDSNYLLETHQYFDPDGSGTNYAAAVPAGTAISRMTRITQWGRQYNKKFLLGEFGIANYPDQIAILAECLQFMNANNDVWKGWTYWTASAHWGGYPYLDEPAVRGPPMSGDSFQFPTLSNNLLQPFVGTPPPSVHKDGQAVGNVVNNTNTFSVTINTTRTNDVIVVGLYLSGTSPGPDCTVSDSAGLTWHKRATRANSNNYIVIQEWVAIAPGVLTNCIITFTGSQTLGGALAAAVAIAGIPNPTYASVCDSGGPQTGLVDPLYITTHLKYGYLIEIFNSWNNQGDGFDPITSGPQTSLVFGVKYVGSIQNNVPVQTSYPGSQVYIGIADFIGTN